MKCRSCQIEKPQSEFYRNKTYSSGYDSRCKSCCKAYFAEHNKIPSVRARKTELSKEWVKANPEKRRASTAKYRAENRDAMLEYGRQWSKDNRDKKNANWQRYRARKKQATVWNDPAIDYVYYAADVIKDVYGGRPDVDHIIPLKHDLVCGLHAAQNLQLMSPSANYSKGNTWPP
jgi:hypothetical protein